LEWKGCVHQFAQYSLRFWQFGNTGEFPLVHTAINKLQMFYQGLEPGQSNCLVHLVDCDEGKVLCAWRISVGVSLPDIARTYDIALPVGKALNKVGYGAIALCVATTVAYLRSCLVIK
jgi:hypothetical protein